MLPLRHPFREAPPLPSPPWTYLLSRAYVRARRLRWVLWTLIAFAAMSFAAEGTRRAIDEIDRGVRRSYAEQERRAGASTLAVFGAAAQRYRASHAGQCPSADEVWRSEVSETGAFVHFPVDRWARPLAIRCAGSRTEVRSAGPDGRFDTGDDFATEDP